MADCIFCQIVARQAPADIMWENDTVIAFRNIAPKRQIHHLIVPKQHIASLDETVANQQAVLGQLLLVARELSQDSAIQEDGYEVVINGGARIEVPHLHLHLLAGQPTGTEVGR